MRERFRRGGALTALLITVFMDMVGFGIIIPLTPFWAERFGAAPDTVTLLFATYSAFGLAFSFLWGWASDRWGRKPVLLASLMGSVLSFLWLGFAEALWMLFAARAVGGISGANVAVGQAYIADVTTEKNRARGFGLFGAAFGLGFVLGPAIGGILAGPDPADPDFRTPFMVAAAMSFVGVVFGLVFLPEPKRRERSGARYSVPAQLAGFARIVAMPAVAVPLLCFTMLGFVMGGLESTFAIWAEREVRWGPRETGFFFAYIGVLLIVVQGWLVSVLVKRYGEARGRGAGDRRDGGRYRHAAILGHGPADRRLRRPDDARLRPRSAVADRAHFPRLADRQPGRDPRRHPFDPEPRPGRRTDHGGRAVRGLRAGHAVPGRRGDPRRGVRGRALPDPRPPRAGRLTARGTARRERTKTVSFDNFS